MFLLAGGPGQAATEAFPPLLPAFAALQRHRDLVLVDQRGTGGSGALRCPAPPPDDLDALLSVDPDTERLRGCLADLQADPTRYGTAATADDLDAVREALGAEQVSLVGGSYGTRVALVYMRATPSGSCGGDRRRGAARHGDSPFVRPGWRAGVRSSDGGLRADPACASAFGDVAATLQGVLDGLPGTPVRVVHPRTGAAVELELHRGTVAAGIRGVLYVPMVASLLPLALARAQAGDPGPLLAQTLLFSDGVRDGFAEGLFLSVLCSEDVPLITEQEIRTETAGTFVGDHVVRALQASCGVWPRAELPPGYRTPVASPSRRWCSRATLDPVTPPRWGEHALAGPVERGRHVVVPGAGHGTLGYACVADLVQDSPRRSRARSTPAASRACGRRSSSTSPGRRREREP